MIRYLKKIFSSNSFKSSIPWISVFFGLFLLLIGIFVEFRNPNIAEFFKALGKSILAGGIVAAILKSMQFMGIFNEELCNIIYEQRFLENRKDLKDVWKNVSKVLFQNKFPDISDAITKDISDIYFPTEHVLYYDDYKQTLEIELIDPATEKVKVIQHSEYVVYPNDKGDTLNLTTKNTLRFNKSKSEVSFTITKFKINGKNITPKIEAAEETSCLRTNFTVSLSGEKYYKFETSIEKEYSLLYDRIIGTKKDYLIHNFNLKVLLKGPLKINFIDAGVLNKFKPNTIANEHFREFEYKGIIYPKQGYVMVIEKKS